MKRRGDSLTNDDRGEPEKEKISKNTLDSDEEIDEVEKGGRMNESDLQVGQEPETIGFDGNVVITPFNMREELEEDGHFDASGTFIFKQTNDAGDNWLEDVDWDEVRRNEQTRGVNGRKVAATAVAEEEALPEMTAEQQTELYRHAAAFLRSGETVLRALRRLGKINSAFPSSTHRRNWVRRKDGTTTNATKSLSPADAANAEAFAKLTELANDLLGTGDFDIYQKTKEIIEDLVVSRTKNKERELDALGAAIDEEAGIESTDGDGAEIEQRGIAPMTKWLVKRAKTVEADAQIEGPFEESVLRGWLNSTSSANIFVKRQDVKEDFRLLTSIDFDQLKSLSV